MAIFKVYALRDVRTEAFHRPMFLQNDAVLDRSIRDAMEDEHNLLCTHPEDYQVYRLGEFDDSNGKLAAIPPEHMFNVIDLRKE